MLLLSLTGCLAHGQYPENDRQAADYVELLKETRLALDQLARSKNESAPYELSIAAVRVALHPLLL